MELSGGAGPIHIDIFVPFACLLTTINNGKLFNKPDFVVNPYYLKLNRKKLNSKLKKTNLIFYKINSIYVFSNKPKYK